MRNNDQLNSLIEKSLSISAWLKTMLRSVDSTDRDIVLFIQKFMVANVTHVTERHSTSVGIRYDTDLIRSFSNYQLTAVLRGAVKDYASYLDERLGEVKIAQPLNRTRLLSALSGFQRKMETHKTDYNRDKILTAYLKELSLAIAEPLGIEEEARELPELSYKHRSQAIILGEEGINLLRDKVALYGFKNATVFLSRAADHYVKTQERKAVRHCAFTYKQALY